MAPLSRRARSAVGGALSRAGGMVDRGALTLIRRSFTSGSPKLPEDARLRMLEVLDHYRVVGEELFAAPPGDIVDEVHSTQLRHSEGREYEVHEITFPSRFRPTLPAFREDWVRYTSNLTAHARRYTGGKNRPVAICLHGWGSGQTWLDERAFMVPYLVHLGIDVVLFQLPFHGQRAPALLPGGPLGASPRRIGPMRRSGALFPSSNVVRTNEAFGQAIWDLRVLARYLRTLGSGPVGVLGMSLGAYTAALWAGLDAELGFAGTFIPAVSMSQLMWTHSEGSAARREAERAGLSAELLDQVFAIHAPLNHPPKLSREQLFIAAARGDRITPPAQAERLWHHWNQPQLVWFTGGHLAQLARGDAFRALRSWLYSLGLLTTLT